MAYESPGVHMVMLMHSILGLAKTTLSLAFLVPLSHLLTRDLKIIIWYEPIPHTITFHNFFSKIWVQ